jgi:hypothetical protein
MLTKNQAYQGNLTIRFTENAYIFQSPATSVLTPIIVCVRPLYALGILINNGDVQEYSNIRKVEITKGYAPQ